MNSKSTSFRAGWAQTDLTPAEPVIISGQMYARISEGVADPVTATALALESQGPKPTACVLVSCDLVAIPNTLRDRVRGKVSAQVSELAPEQIILHATHTHTAPEVRLSADSAATGGGNVPHRFGVELEAMPVEEYVEWATDQIAGAVVQAWENRRPAGMAFGLGQATVGYNRRMAFEDGTSKMYGNPNTPEFSHIEGAADTSVNVLGFYDANRNLTGVAVNLACPCQVVQGDWKISADYWHQTRQELRRRLGPDLFILPLNSASGDQCPATRNTMIDWRAQQRMWRLQETDQRQDIARRLADAVGVVLEAAGKEIDPGPVLRHHHETVGLTRRKLSQKDVDEALAEADRFEADYEGFRRELEAHPERKKEPRWYKDITNAYRRMHWNRMVAERFELQKTEPRLPMELHVLRLGEVALATNPFEYYLDYSHQIRARSKAVQTLLVQHVGSGTYLPTRRAAAGGGYGAVPASSPVGPEGGKELAEWTVQAVNKFWPETA